MGLFTDGRIKNFTLAQVMEFFGFPQASKEIEQVEPVGRKMATIRRVDEITPIKGADRIEAAKFGGWTVVVGKGMYNEGDLVVFCEIDSAIPLHGHLDEDGSLAKRGKKTVDGNDYHVVKTIRLRGVVSQGLTFPLSVLGGAHEEGEDVSAELGIFKYDPFEQKTKANRPQRNGKIVGPFPTDFARKSDSERVQNLGKQWPALQNYTWFLTEKIDGQSVTLINDGGTLRVASRNYEVKEHPAKEYALKSGFLDEVPSGMAIQGEWAGPGVQGNRLKLDACRFFVFAVFKDGEATGWGWPQWALDREVPYITWGEPVSKRTINGMIEVVDGLRSQINPEELAEGVVCHEIMYRPVPELGGRVWWCGTV